MAPKMALFETIALEASKKLAGLVLSTAWGMGDKSIDKPLKQTIFKASGRYIKNYRNRHGILKVLGMTKPVSLEAIYTTAQLLDARALKRFETIEGLQELFREGNKRRFQRLDTSRRPGVELANAEQYLMVLGGPGVGKSTFLRKMGLEALKGNQGDLQHQCIPVFLELKRFDTDEINIRQLLIDEFKTYGFPEPERFTDQALQKGRLLVLLDGLDEAPSQNLTQVIRQIQDFVDQYAKNRFIASCRIAAYYGDFRRFTDVAIADFDDTQIEQFIRNWFHSQLDRQTKTAEKCWQLLQRPENQAAKELAQTPLLLTFLCLVYDSSQNLPKNRSTLYNKALDILLEKWAAEKRILQGDIYQGLHTDLEKALLAEIAYKEFEAGRLFFQKEEITQEITTFLAETLEAPKHLNSKAVLKAIEVQQGILVERAEDIYSFSHLTLQEFLTAQYIADDPDEVNKLVSNHLTDTHWREVFLLVAGLKRSADTLLLLMEQQVQSCLNTPKLQALIQWLDKATSGSKGFYKSSTKRVAALFLVRALDLNLDLNLDLEHARARARDLNLDLDLNLTRALKYALERAHTLDRTLARDLTLALALSRDLDRTLAFSLARDLARNHELASSLTLDLNLNRTLALSRDRSRDRSHDLARDLARDLELAFARSRDLALDRARLFSQLNIFNTANFYALISKLEVLTTQIPSKEESKESRRDFIAHWYDAWFSALQIDPDLVKLSTEEADTLAQYFEANRLIIACKTAAVRVSRQVWEGIEERMLTISKDNQSCKS